MPAYDVAAVAEALDIPLRRLDNLLCRNDIPGAARHRRGVGRVLTTEAAVTISLALDLSDCLGIPLASALRLAGWLQAKELRGRFVVLRADVERLHASVSIRLNEAVEAVGKRSRGRPRRSRIAAPDEAK